jgi:hypothetical protein
MDPLEPLLVAALSKIAEGSLGAAGTQLWEELKRLARRRGAPDREAVALDQPALAIDAPSVAAALTRRTMDDPELRLELENWQAEVQRQIDGDVSNTVTGDVHGTIVQARDIGSLRID